MDGSSWGESAAWLGGAGAGIREVPKAVMDRAGGDTAVALVGMREGGLE